MNVTRKDAAIIELPAADSGPGEWTAILSAPTKDRDGDTLNASGWKMPLPSRIPIDIDHEMSVRGTIGSGVPSIDADGNLVVHCEFSSLPLAQDVRTLMQEGHIDRMSVAYMSEKTTKDGATEVIRELLNGAVVCIPSNREAAVLEVRGMLHAKRGARNNRDDLALIQTIHDATAHLGASCVHDNADGNDADGDEKNVSDVTTPDVPTQAPSDEPAPADDADESASTKSAAADDFAERALRYRAMAYETLHAVLADEYRNEMEGDG